MLYISTDYVFDGKSAPYGEGDTPNPLNTYGKNKLAGEQVTLQSENGDQGRPFKSANSRISIVNNYLAS